MKKLLLLTLLLFAFETHAASVILDRYNGVNSGIAIKVPVKVATTANITLSGEQTIDDVTVVDGDRVFVKDQTSAFQDGVYKASTGTWSRAVDWDGSFDIVNGSLVYAALGTVNGGKLFSVTSPDPITIGTTSMSFGTSNFSPVPSATESLQGIAEIATQAETNTGTDDTRTITPLKLKTYVAAQVPAASETAAGKAELATQAETDTGTDDARIVTPLKLKTSLASSIPAASESTAGKAELATQTETNTGTDDARIVTPLKLAADPVLDIYGISNGSLNWTVGSNAMTVTLQTKAGATPSASDPVYVRFRNSSLTSGTYVIRTVTSSLSLVVTSGSTLGTTSAVGSRIRAVLIDNAGTVKIGVYNSFDGTNYIALNDSALYTSVAEGGAGTADSALVLYSDAVYSSKAVIEVGYEESDQTTAGTWAQAIDKTVTKGYGKYNNTGDIIQSVLFSTGATSNGTTTVPADDTIPQSGEGNQQMTQAITPQSKANLLSVLTQVVTSCSAVVGQTSALFVDAVANALVATNAKTNTGDIPVQLNLLYATVADATASRTYKVRTGCATAGTETFNGGSSARLWGGVANSYILINETFL